MKQNMTLVSLAHEMCNANVNGKADVLFHVSFTMSLFFVFSSRRSPAEIAIVF